MWNEICFTAASCYRTLSSPLCLQLFSILWLFIYLFSYENILIVNCQNKTNSKFYKNNNNPGKNLTTERTVEKYLKSSQILPPTRNILMYTLQNFFFFFGRTTQLVGSLVPEQRSNLGPWPWKPGILTTGQPGNSLLLQNFKQRIFLNVSLSLSDKKNLYLHYVENNSFLVYQESLSK